MCVKKIAVLGGDMRIVTLAEAFYREGYDVSVFGFSEKTEMTHGIERADNVKEAIVDADAVVTGLPATSDGITLLAPFWNEKIYFDDILKCMTKNQLLLGGKITPELRDKCKMYNIKFADYLEREELTVLNAVPTAEGAIEIAMRTLPITLHESRSLVLGFGRIGKILAKDFAGLGAKTYVEARRFDDMAWIKAYGYEGIYLPLLKDSLPTFDIICNTVPHQILTEDMLRYIRKDCLIIDLASHPGGVDRTLAEKHGITVISALSLPGKASPKTSGEIIKYAIGNIFSDMGV